MNAEVEDLTTRARAGDVGAFRQLIEPWLGQVRASIVRRGIQGLGADCDAEDVVQVALGKAWQLLDRVHFSDHQAVGRWLVALGRGVAADRVRYARAARRGPARHVESLWQDGDGPCAKGATASEIACRGEAGRRAEAALERLDPSLREVVRLHILEGCTVRDIARVLGLSPNGVFERLRRGLLALRRDLRSEFSSSTS